MLVLHIPDLRRQFFLGQFDFLLAADLHGHQSLADVELDQLKQFTEQFKGLALVFLLRVLLRVTAQVYALAQVVQCGQVLAPVGVESREHDKTLVLVHRIPGRLLEFFPVSPVRPFNRSRQKVLVGQVGLGLQQFFQLEMQLQFGGKRGLKTRDVPLFFHTLGWNMRAEQVFNHAFTQGPHALGDIGALEDLVAQLVYMLALVV